MEKVVLRNGEVEEVEVHGKMGPVVVSKNSSGAFSDPTKNVMFYRQDRLAEGFARKWWYEMSPSEKTVFLDIAARKNKALRELWGLPKPGSTKELPPPSAEPQYTQEEIDAWNAQQAAAAAAGQ